MPLDPPPLDGLWDALDQMRIHENRLKLAIQIVQLEMPEVTRIVCVDYRNRPHEDDVTFDCDVEDTFDVHDNHLGAVGGDFDTPAGHIDLRTREHWTDWDIFNTAGDPIPDYQPWVIDVEKVYDWVKSAGWTRMGSLTFGRVTQDSELLLRSEHGPTCSLPL